jgi:nucleolar protein 4
VHKVNDPLAIRTILVSGLPTSINQKTLWKKLRKFEGAQSVEWPAKIAGGEDLSTGELPLSLIFLMHFFRTLIGRV